MANMARMDLEKRTVEVNRLQLIKTLRENKDRHVAEYVEAMSGYKAALLEKIHKAYDEAKRQIESKYMKLCDRVTNLDDVAIAKQQDYFTLLDGIDIEMKVPRSYANEYDAAIDMASWDVRETLELTHAEFTCFVRDQWDWKSSFESTSNLYKSIGVSR